MDKGGPKHPLPGEGRKARKERVGSPLEKIFLLVRGGHAPTTEIGIQTMEPGMHAADANFYYLVHW
jgi:hypothetical protein